MQNMAAIEDNVEVRIITKASIADLTALYRSAGWWNASFDQNPEFLKSIVADSALFAGAFFKDKMIGMGRALSDKASDAYIQDVAVLEKFRSNGIGKRIIMLLVKRLKAYHIDWIGLIARPGTSSFYEKLGFERLDGYIPLKYKD